MPTDPKQSSKTHHPTDPFQIRLSLKQFLRCYAFEHTLTICPGAIFGCAVQVYVRGLCRLLFAHTQCRIDLLSLSQSS